jgi:hypothetical protein
MAYFKGMCALILPERRFADQFINQRSRANGSECRRSGCLGFFGATRLLPLPHISVHATQCN